MGKPTLAPADAAPETVTTGLFVPTAGEAGGAFPPFDATTFAPQLVWLILTFGLLYYLMSRIALPRIGEVIEARRERIQRDLDEAARMKTETDAALKAYEDALASARGKAQGIAKETRDRITAEVDAERHRVDSEIAAKVADTEKRIAANKAQALTSVSDIASDTAGAIVNRLLGEDVPANEIKAAVAAATRG